MREEPRRDWVDVACACVVGVLAFAVLTPALSGEFLYFDDDRNYLENPHYRGLGPTQLAWMFTHMDGHYQPLMWLSHGFDYLLFGMEPQGYHLVNLLIHAASAVLAWRLLTLLLARVPGLQGVEGRVPVRLAAAAGALLFALHPLRVEAVAWITQRRAVLMLFFVLLSLIAYLRSNESGVAARVRQRWLAASVTCFGLAWLSNALCMTLPVLLLLLDAYPLGRLRSRVDVRPLVIEKIPFFAITVIGMAVQVLSQSAGGAIDPDGTYGLADVVTQPGYRLAFYWWKTLWPTGLHAMYALPFDRDPFAPVMLLCGAAMVVTTLALIALARRAPALLASWLAFALILSPVLGLLQVGPHFASDRNTYLAGLVPAALAAGGLARLWRAGRLVWPSAALTAAVIAILAVLSWQQSQIWLDTETLWTQTIRHDPYNAIALYGLGHESAKRADHDTAIELYTRAIDARESDTRTWFNRGISLVESGEYRRAIDDFTVVLEREPENAWAWSNRGIAHMLLGEPEPARADLDRAIELGFEYIPTVLARARVAEEMGDDDEAKAFRRRARDIRMRGGR